MSTKKTISHGPTFHLFQEAFERDSVWLQLEDCKVKTTRNGTSVVTVAIPVHVWRKVVKDWAESHWAQHPDLDNQALDVEPWVQSLFEGLSEKK